MVPVGAAVRNAEEQREFQRERTLRGLLHRPTQGDSSHGGLRLQDRARAGWQVRRLRLRDRRVERNSPAADGQGESVYSRSVHVRGIDPICILTPLQTSTANPSPTCPIGKRVTPLRKYAGRFS